jgi:cystathionine beta-lyase
MTKPEGGDITAAELKPDAKLGGAGRDPFKLHGHVNPPLNHASTPLNRTAEGILARRGEYFYGRSGTPTSEAPQKAFIELEGPACADVASRPSGLSVISTELMGVLRAGDHVLVTDSCHGPTREFCDRVLSRCDVATTYHDPLAGGGIAAFIQPNTRAITEAPGSLSFEMKDAPAIAAAAFKALWSHADPPMAIKAPQ